MATIGKRSSRKAIFIEEGVIRALDRNEKNPSSLIKIWSRASTIIPRFVGKTVYVYNGREFKSFIVTDSHIGHKFGEFSPTKVQVKHTSKDKKSADKKGKK